LFIIKSMLTLVFCLQTIKRNEPAPHSDAVLGLRLLSLTLHGRSTVLNCAITIVQYRLYQYRRILYGHVVGMVRCDWPITVGYIINVVYCIFLSFHCTNILGVIIKKVISDDFTNKKLTLVVKYHLYCTC